MSPSLNRVAGRGAVVTLGTQGVRLVVQVVGLAVLGRLLTPHDYGLVAIVSVLVSAGEIFRDFGLSAAAIQAKTLSAAQRDNLFWINSGMGLVLAVVLCAASPLLAHLYGDDRLVLLAVVMASVFVLNGLSTQYRAGLARDLQFGRLSGAELIGQVTGVAVAVAVAVLGGGYWALAAQWVSAQCVVLVLLVAWSRWVPGRVDRTASVRPFVRFGSALLGTTLLNNAVSYAPPLALGLTSTPAAVGVYGRAQQLVTMPLLQIQAPTTRVALPVLSRLQDDTKRFAELLLRGQLLLLTLIGLLFAVLFAQAPAAVRVLVGPQWGAAVPLFRLLLVAGFLQAATYAANWVFQARGRTGSQLRFFLLTKPLFVLAIAVGAWWGPVGTATAYTLACALGWPLSLLWMRRLGGVPVARMLGNGLRTGVLVVLASSASWAATHVVPLPAVLDLVVGGLVAVAVAAAAIGLLPAHRRELAVALRAVRSSRRGGGTGPGAGGAPGGGARRGGPVRRARATLRRVATRAWFSSGVPTSLDRWLVRSALRRARRAGTAGAPAGGLHLVLAAPGAGNVGDQALLEAVVERSAPPVLLAVPLAQTPALPQAIAGRVELLDAPHLLYGDGAQHRASVRRYGAALARVSHVSLIGADVMDGGYSLPASVRRSALVTAAAQAGLDTRVIGFSWNGSPRWAARRGLRRAGAAGVRLLARDPVSAGRLRRDGVRGVSEVADVVFAARSVDESAAAQLLQGVSAPVALVNASGLIARRADLRDDHERVVRGLLDRGLHVVLLPHVARPDADDLAACRDLAARFAPGEVQLVDRLLTPAQVRGLARRAAVVVTGRMHLAVMSLLSGVPAITLATQGKVEGLAQLFGTPELAVEPVPGFADRVLPLVDRSLPVQSRVRAAVAASRARVIALAELNFTGLGLLDPRTRDDDVCPSIDVAATAAIPVEGNVEQHPR
ncbi:oligosaccharide flippase family protein [Kineococcus sp. SYSU DK006]|uniref:oligosaccharide flippase family protein n=1 Tax=Kineococcus sp. SYSU DK006 TaxID=3383127 RepID=UPI003D7CEBDD